MDRRMSSLLLAGEPYSLNHPWGSGGSFHTIRVSELIHSGDLANRIFYHES